MGSRVSLVQGSVRKICQLTGEDDRQLGKKAFNQTEADFSLYGAYLSSSFNQYLSHTVLLVKNPPFWIQFIFFFDNQNMRSYL